MMKIMFTHFVIGVSGQQQIGWTMVNGFGGISDGDQSQIQIIQETVDISREVLDLWHKMVAAKYILLYVNWKNSFDFKVLVLVISIGNKNPKDKKMILS